MGNKSSSGSSDYTSSSDSDSSEEERATSSRQHRDKHRARGGSKFARAEVTVIDLKFYGIVWF